MRGSKPGFLLANHAQLPETEKPLLRFPPNSCAVKFDIIPEDIVEWGGHIVVALFGDEKPMTAPAGPPVGGDALRDPINRGLSIIWKRLCFVLYQLS